MNIPSAKYLKNKARNRLASGREPQKVILVYSAITAVASFLVTAVRYGLDSQISQSGGLANIGTRSMLSTAGNVLQILEYVLVLCLTLGYMAAMLRISRRQYASPMTLKAGVERFWTLLVSRILQGLIYVGVSIAASFLSVRIFLMTPLANPFLDVITPLAESGAISPDTLMENTALMDSLMGKLTPMLVINLLIALPAIIFIAYRFRLTDYIILDNPGMGASACMRQSRYLMRGNAWRLCKVDLSFWWYYLLRAVCSVILYLDLILALFGIFIPELPAFFGTIILYLGADFAMNYFLRNKLEVTYALAYTSLVPKEKDEGVVLGNIFNM